MTAGDSILIVTLVTVLAWLVLEQEKDIRDLREDIDLLARGDTDLLKAKRKLGKLRVSRETEI
jgi:hypothetical protein